MRTLSLLISFAVACGSNAQTDTLRDQTSEPAPLIDPAELPSFPGGETAMCKFIKENLRYPLGDVQGRVYVQFIVEVDGTLSVIEIQRGVHELLDREALRLVTSFPKWEPSKVNSKSIQCQYVLPVLFKR